MTQKHIGLYNQDVKVDVYLNFTVSRKGGSLYLQNTIKFISELTECFWQIKGLAG